MGETISRDTGARVDDLSRLRSAIILCNRLYTEYNWFSILIRAVTIFRSCCDEGKNRIFTAFKHFSHKDCESMRLNN